MENTKDLIYRKSLELFYEKGFENTTLVDICTACNITKRTFYYHYASKNEILSNITHELGKQSEKALLEEIANTSFLDKVWKVMAVYAEGGKKYGPDIIKQVYLLSLENTAEEHFPMDTYMYNTVNKLIQGAIDTKELNTKSSAEDLTFTLYHSFRSITITWAFENGSFSIEDAFKKCFETIL